MGLRIGIDLGTTNSVVGYLKAGHPEVVANTQGEYWTPSVVQVDEEGQLLVGRMAKDNLSFRPDATVFSIKRFIGRSPGDADLKRARELVPYRVDDPPAGKTDLVVHLGSKQYTPIEISAMILRKLVEDTTAALGQKPSEVVITVPAYFSERQKDATRQAGKLAGLTVRRVLDEPTAAALAYGMDVSSSGDKCLLVFDLGGGTFDVSILAVTGGQFTTLKITGDNFLGGDDFDNVILLRLLEDVKKQTGQDLEGDSEVRAHLKKASEDAKIALSTTNVHAVNLFVPPSQKNPSRPLIGLATKLERSWFESASRRLVDRAMEQVSRALSEAGLDVSEVHHVLMVGGSSRIPAVLSAVEKVFGASKISREMNPMLCVAQGAAILVETIGEGREDEVISRSTAKPLGIELEDGAFDAILPADTYYPTEPKKAHYKTAGKNQRELRVSFYEGEKEKATDNEWMGDVVAKFGEGLPENTPVTLSVRLDKDGILFVTVDVAGYPQAVQGARVARDERASPHKEEPAGGKPDAQFALEIIGAFLNVCARPFVFFPKEKDALSHALGKVTRAIEMGSPDGAKDAEAAMAQLNQVPPHLDIFFFGTFTARDDTNRARGEKISRGLSEAERACFDKDFAAFEAALASINPLVRAAMDERGGGGGKSAIMAGLRRA